MTRTIIGIPLGDIAGIGPESVVKALTDPARYQIARPLVIGEAGGRQSKRYIARRQSN